MKQLKRRALFVLFFAGLLAVGCVIFCGLLVRNGGQWASSSVNQNAYSGGSLAMGQVYDRTGLLLYDCASGSYAEGANLRRSTLHLIGDRQGNIATGAKKLFVQELVGYHPITGLSEQGNRVYLTVDGDLNRTAYKALKGRSGVVAVYNYLTGEVVCLVSAPSFDPIDEVEVTAVANGDSSYSGAYLNRFYSSVYTPGSVFKVVTAAAALETLDTDHFTFTCTGSFAIGGDSVTCPGAHGELNFEQALCYSCNGAFAQLALELGGDVLADYAEKAGLLEGFDLHGRTTAAGSFAVADDNTIDLGWSGAGQYKTLVSPAAMLTLMGCIAGDGTAAQPRLLMKVTTPEGLPAAIVTRDQTAIGWDEATCIKLQEMMRGNVTENYGQKQFGDLAVCAKSGTAEVGSDVKPHAWFAGFVDDTEHPYAFVVLVEHGGWGSSAAGSIAAEVLQQLCEEG